MDLKCTAILPNDYTTYSLATLEGDKRGPLSLPHNNRGKRKAFAQ